MRLYPIVEDNGTPITNMNEANSSNKRGKRKLGRMAISKMTNRLLP